MAVTKIAPARVKVQIAGPRGVAGPAGPAGPGGPKRLRVLAMVTHSWGHVDTLSPLNSERQAMQDALDTEYGVGTWLVVRYTLGGSALGPVGIQPRGLEMLQRALARGDVDTVWLQHGVNDLALGRTDSQFIGDVTTAAGYCTAAGKNLVVSTIGPFKGTGPGGSGSIHTVYSDAPTNTIVDPTATAAKYTLLKGYADAINSHILTTFGAKAHDEYDLFNTPGNDGVFRVDMRFDDFHPSHAGKVASAAKFVAEQDLGTASGTAPAISITRDVNVDQSLTQQSSVAFKSVRVGFDDGEVAPVTIRRSDLNFDGPHLALIQRVDTSAGWLQGVYDNGAMSFQRIGGGLVQSATLQLNYASPSLLSGQFAIAADAATLDLSGTVFGGGSGVKWRSEPDGSSGWKQTAFSAGGASLGSATYTASVHIFEPIININAPSGSPELQLTRAGVNKARLFHDGTNTVVCVASGATGVYVTDGATSWSALSSRELKRDFEPLDGEDAAARVAALDWQFFRLKTDEDDAPLRAGLVAEEVQEVLPDIVKPGPGGHLGVDYTGTLPWLGSALQWLMKENAALKAANDNLAARITALESAA